MSFGIFEAAVSSEQEVGLARQSSVAAKEAAIYDVREKLGPSLFASTSLEQFRHRVAMMKTDQSVYKIIGAHIHPGASVVRQIVGRGGVLEKEFKQRLADVDQANSNPTDPSGSAAGRSAPDLPSNPVTPSGPSAASTPQTGIGMGNGGASMSGTPNVNSTVNL